eukprot:TRINITY_DN45391_c0_g1_i1.p1 TRINITY_DN45391_c0_g1~~TRINITY_DN45391_c0_g1_i1.p1  ORF type:complete len:320 (+),score=52.43 TRINITY_DN45391_c0_g1_i1:190-1149(+)
MRSSALLLISWSWHQVVESSRPQIDVAHSQLSVQHRSKSSSKSGRASPSVHSTMLSKTDVDSIKTHVKQDGSWNKANRAAHSIEAGMRAEEHSEKDKEEQAEGFLHLMKQHPNIQKTILEDYNRSNRKMHEALAARREQREDWHAVIQEAVEEAAADYGSFDEDIKKDKKKTFESSCCRCGPHFKHKYDTVVWSKTGDCDVLCQQLFSTQADQRKFKAKGECMSVEKDYTRDEKFACREQCRQVYADSQIREPSTRAPCDGPGCYLEVDFDQQQKYIDEAKGFMPGKKRKREPEENDEEAEGEDGEAEGEGEDGEEEEE